MERLIGILIRLTFGELLMAWLFYYHFVVCWAIAVIVPLISQPRQSKAIYLTIQSLSSQEQWHDTQPLFSCCRRGHIIILQSAINHQALTLSSPFVYFERVAQSKCQYESWRWSTNKSPWFMLFAYLATITIRKHSSLSPRKPTQINRHRDYWDFSRPPESNNRDLFHFIDRGWCGAQRRVIRMVSRPATGGRGVPFNYTSNRRRHELPALPGSQLFFPFFS